MGAIVMLIISSPMTFAMRISESYFGGESESAFRVVRTVYVAVGFMSWAVWEMYRCVMQLRSFRLGLDGEIAVDQELDLLMHHGGACIPRYSVSVW